MALHEIVDTIAHLDLCAKALWSAGQWFTWQQLNERGDAALALASSDPDESIGVVLRNDADCVGVLVAALRARRPVLTYSPLLPDATLAADVRATRPATLIAGEREWARPGLLDAAVEAGALGVCLAGTVTPVASTTRHGVDHHRAPGVAASMLTSGTTGPPKRAPVTPQALAAAIEAANAHHDGDRAATELRLRDATTIIDLPLFNISAYLDLATTLSAGRRICLLERFEPLAWGRAVRDHAVVVALLVPAAMRMVLDADVPKEWLTSLRVVRSGSAPLDPALAAAFEDRYDIPVIVAYGATEFSGAIASLTMRDRKKFGTAKRGSVGRPHPGVEVRIVDPADGRLLGPDEVGVLLARGPQVGTEADGWARTNDLARLDADGFLYIVGRIDDVIIRGGFKIDPDDVTAALLEHADVSDAAVIGLADERLGQVPAAVVVLQESDGRSVEQLEEELRQWVRDRRPPYAVPVRIRAVDAIPRTPTLKVARTALAEVLAR